MNYADFNAETAGGFGSPEYVGGQPPQSGFFTSVAWNSLYGRTVRETRKGLPVPTTGLPTRTDSPTRLEAGKRKFKTLSRRFAMATISKDASASITTPNELIVHTPWNGIAEYHGTRAMLEAEGVIPEATQWPTGYVDLCWKDSQGDYRLCRNRPEGAKGPRKQFIDVDWWHFRFSPVHTESYVARELKRKAKERAGYIYLTSDKGRSELSANFNRYLETRKDEKFQSFKALIPGLIKPTQTRRTKNANQSQGAAS